MKIYKVSPSLPDEIVEVDERIDRQYESGRPDWNEVYRLRLQSARLQNRYLFDHRIPSNWVKLLVGSVVAAALAAALAKTAHAQVIVNDPPALIKDAMIAVSTGKMVAGMIHGNGFASLLPSLGSQLTANPMSGINPTSMMSGIGNGGALSGMFGQFANQATGGMQITGDDPNAQLLRARAQAEAGQMAVGQQFVNSGQSRLNQMPGLTNAIGDTTDVKDSIDADARINGEHATTAAQQQQIDALRLYQQAQHDNEQTQRELAYRRGAEDMAASANSAAGATQSGTVRLVNN